MTEQEFKVFEARMLRVWMSVHHMPTLTFEKRWTFGVWVAQRVALYVDVDAFHDEPFFEMRGMRDKWGEAGLRYEEEEIEDRAGGEEQEEFTNKWLSYFRRGLWLSGCAVEASAHEKAEWMQGFTREEVEAWNLV